MFTDVEAVEKILCRSLQPGDRLRLGQGDRTYNWWLVRKVSPRFIILTRQAAFRPKGEVEYTIIDNELGVRGPVNLIGGGWDMHMDDEACDRLMAALHFHLQWHAENRARYDNGDPGPYVYPDEPMVQVSERNNVPVSIVEIAPV